MAESANGTTISFSGAHSDVRSISFSENGNPIDVSVLGSANHIWELGLIDTDITVETVGQSAITVSTTSSAAVVTWSDGSSAQSANAICVGKEVSGSLDTEITTSLTFKPVA